MKGPNDLFRTDFETRFGSWQLNKSPTYLCTINKSMPRYMKINVFIYSFRIETLNFERHWHSRDSSKRKAPKPNYKQ